MQEPVSFVFKNILVSAYIFNIHSDVIKVNRIRFLFEENVTFL